MSEISERHRKVAAHFTQRARAVPDSAWDNPAPCEGWVARDVVRHLVNWMPGFFLGNWGVEFPEIPPVDEDPVGAWEVVSNAIQSALDEPEIATRENVTAMDGSTFEQAVELFCIADVLVHTWDLARATGLDETLDTDEIHRLAEVMDSKYEPLRLAGHLGPRIEVPDDADEQTKVLAFTGRRQ